MLFSVVVLPAPFAPIIEHDLALLHLERDALDGADPAVGDGNVGQSEERLALLATAGARRARMRGPHALSPR